MLVNDSDPRGQRLFIAGVSLSGNGSTVSMSTSDGETFVNYTPPLNYIGSDFFLYTNQDEWGL